MLHQENAQGETRRQLPAPQLQEVRLGTENEFRISKLSHLRQIETSDFSLDRNALTKDDVEDPIEDEAEGEDEADQRCDADELRHQLAGISIEQAGDGAGNAIPGAAIVTGAVSEQADGEHTPESAGSVDRDGADWIVDFEVILNKGDAEADQHAGDEADDGGASRC